MDWSTFCRVLDEAINLGANEIAFSGGEPLLWENIEGAVSRSSKHGIRTILYTTGNVPNAEMMIRNLHNIGLGQVAFSVFGINSEQHEMVTNKAGSYSRTIELAKYSSAIGLATEFHFVPFSWNYKILPEIVYHASKIGVRRVSVLRLVPQGRGKDIIDGSLNKSQNIELRNIIKKLLSNGFDIRLGSPYNFLMLQEDPQCRAGIDRMTIGPDFRIFPCDAFKHISPEGIGVSSDYSNLRSHTLKECWERSPYFQAVQEYLMTDVAVECKSCATYNKCKSGCVAQKFFSYGRLLKSPDPMCLIGTK